MTAYELHTFKIPGLGPYYTECQVKVKECHHKNHKQVNESLLLIVTSRESTEIHFVCLVRRKAHTSELFAVVKSASQGGPFAFKSSTISAALR